ncbi:MAG: hypothetical protein K2X77_11885 [Candidatus Obscuribacterales bacterium]|nr:hypothetical protein [Candidatus Obscuribacterales bacterium]
MPVVSEATGIFLRKKSESLLKIEAGKMPALPGSNRTPRERICPKYGARTSRPPISMGSGRLVRP